jgi:hypothetical protein
MVCSFPFTKLWLFESLLICLFESASMTQVSILRTLHGIRHVTETLEVVRRSEPDHESELFAVYTLVYSYNMLCFSASGVILLALSPFTNLVHTPSYDTAAVTPEGMSLLTAIHSLPSY